MLATNDSSLTPVVAAPGHPGLEVTAAPSADGLPLLVELPAELSNFFIESGYLETVYGEQRCQSRLRVRCTATLCSDFIPPFAERTPRRARVLIKDMSRSGLGILSHEQLWPGETFHVELHDRRLHVRVVRCRRLGSRCYEVGGLVIGID